MIQLRIFVARLMSIRNLLSLHRMYDSLSYDSKRFFHPGFLGLENISFTWFLAQIALMLSSVDVLKKLLLHIYPYSVFSSLVATSKGNEIIAFAFLKVKKRLPNRSFLAELGMVIKDNYQGRGLGSRLMAHLIEIAKKEGIRRTYLRVLTNNIRAISLYRKYGFKEKGIIERGDIWRGQRYNCIEMWLDIP